MPPQHEGKVVAHFSYVPDDRPNGNVISIPVRLVQQVEREKVRGLIAHEQEKKYVMESHTKSALFRVILDAPVKMDYTCTDIEVLRRIVFSELEEKYTLDWVEWYLVEVSDENRFGGEGEGVQIEYKPVEVATLEDGTKVHRFDDAYRGRDIRIGMPTTGSARDRMQSLLLATPENKAALEDFCSRIKYLRDKLKDFLSPKNIQKNLSQLGLLLPAPAPASNPKGAKHGRQSD